MSAKLSVLTLVKDRPGHLAQLLEGLRRSAILPDELVIVDMGSRMPVVVGEMPVPVQLLRIEGPGLPLAAARNAAARAATGRTFLFLDVDCIPMRNLAGAMTQLLESYDALVCAEVRYLGPNDARDKWTESELMAAGAGHLVRQFPAAGFREEENAGLFWSLAFGIRRSRFFSLGGFDEAFTGYGAEDTDFGFRAKDASLPLLFLGGVGAMHQHHDAFDPPLQHLEDIVRNAQVFYERWRVWPMEGWLAQFESAGYIRRDQHVVKFLRRPSDQEIAQARALPVRS